MLASNERGSTVLEVLIGLSLGAFIIASSIGMMYGILRSNVDTLRVTRLEHELRTAINLMAGDIRRTGFWGNAISDIDTNANNNPFLTGGNELQVSANCILFSYDTNNDGSIPALDTDPEDERYGFRLVNNTVQSRPASHGTLDCSDGDDEWENITNNDLVNITNLTFTLNSQSMDIDGAGAGTATIGVRRVDISITGALTSDAGVSRTLTESVRIRNDLYTP